MEIDNRRLSRLRRLSMVPRWAVIPTIRSQSVAEHSYYVAVIALRLRHFHAAADRGGIDAAELMHAALCHDELEAFTGDIASPAKRWMDSNEVAHQEYETGCYVPGYDAVGSILKLADLIEAYVFLMEEWDLGNKSVGEVAEDVSRKIQSHWEAMHKSWAGNALDAVTLAWSFYTQTRISDHPSVSQVE